MNLADELETSMQEKKEKIDKDKAEEINQNIKKKVKELETKRGGRVFLFLGNDIDGETVTEVFEELRKDYSENIDKLDVIVDSGGGDIHSAYNLACLLRNYGKKELNFIIPRWSKSASTLLACGGDNIFMTKIAELGPLDPQITQMNPIENRLENFSPLYIESTLNLIRDEMVKGNEKLGELLVNRLQFPITLGGFLRSIEIGEQYLIKLLKSRMFADDKSGIAEQISEKLTKGYCDHGFCINLNEAKELKLKVGELAEEELKLVWEIYTLYMEKDKLEKKVNKEEMLDMIRDFPEDLRKLLENKGLNKKINNGK